jgi:hypothetical protein
MTRCCVLFPLALLVCSDAARGRTIEMTCFDLTGFAVISPEAPLQGWVGTGQSMTADKWGNFSSASIDVIPPRSMLVRFDLSQIPKGMQITNAELVVPVSYQPGVVVRLSVFRLMAEWGVGVCEKFRMRRPQELPWGEAGARGAGTDRTVNPTAHVELSRVATEARINVTGDVELWYSGGASNQGWIFIGDDPGQWVRIVSPIYSGREGWRLRITYEPKP